ncbi:hypothetical protein BRC86_03275 [Halobacteriales archaeon QS_3_64_16]|nr:MAG: hypothetical protein BRC86_03275 [Halobacteriales archaeon QS_3_64_16]
MKRLIIHGDAGVRKGGVIEYDGDEQVLFQVNRNGEWHGPDRVQLWCVIGPEKEREDFQRRNFIPMFLDVESADAEDIDVIQPKGKPAAQG